MLIECATLLTSVLWSVDRDGESGGEGGWEAGVGGQLPSTGGGELVRGNNMFYPPSPY